LTSRVLNILLDSGIRYKIMLWYENHWSARWM